MSEPIVPIVKYKAIRGSIHRIECSKETGKTVTMILPKFLSDGYYEKKEAKLGPHHGIFDSWTDAREYLLREAMDDVVEARRSLELANSYLGNVKGMKPPKE